MDKAKSGFSKHFLNFFFSKEVQRKSLRNTDLGLTGISLRIGSRRNVNDPQPPMGFQLQVDVVGGPQDHRLHLVEGC
jgi:hypothetical protein